MRVHPACRNPIDQEWQWGKVWSQPSYFCHLFACRRGFPSRGCCQACMLSLPTSCPHLHVVCLSRVASVGPVALRQGHPHARLDCHELLAVLQRCCKHRVGRRRDADEVRRGSDRARLPTIKQVLTPGFGALQGYLNSIPTHPHTSSSSHNRGGTSSQGVNDSATPPHTFSSNRSSKPQVSPFHCRKCVKRRLKQLRIWPATVLPYSS